MDFDQMMDAWRAQDDKPLYGVNRDLLQLVLRHEQAELRRTLRWELWITCIVGAAMAALAGGLIWAFLHNRSAAIYPAAAAAGMAIVLLGVGAFWLSRRRQARRERGFGNSLREEIRRNLSLIDYQLSRAGRWSAATLWSAPVMVAASLLYWLIAEINDNTPFWYDVGIVAFIVVSILWTTFETSRKTRRELEPRRRRLSELLDVLNASE